MLNFSNANAHKTIIDPNYRPGTSHFSPGDTGSAQNLFTNTAK